MIRRTRRTLLALAAVLLAAPGAACAQEAMLQPQPLAADAPTAKRAREVAELLLAGDQAKLEGYLKANGTPTLVAKEGMAAELTRLVELARSGARTIAGFDDLGEGRVGVTLATGEGAPPVRAVLVTLEPQAPHRVTALTLVRIQVDGP